jgi:iron(III) transport system permease protein
MAELVIPDRQVFTPPKQTLSRDEWLMRGLILAISVWLFIVLLFPVFSLLSKSFHDKDGNFVGVANFVAYFATPSLVEGITNSLFIAGLTTLISIGLALPFAFALTRTCMPCKSWLRGVALLKLLAPSLLPAIAIRYLLGNNGYLHFLMGDHSVYGPIGIVIGLVVYTFPHALLIITAAFSTADARLYESAVSLGASRVRIFFTVVLPGAKLGIASAIMVVFTLAMTDFGVPKVTGGDYNVLAIDVYTQIIGRQNFEMGAVVATVLLMPAVLAFFVDRAVRRRHMATITTESVPYQPKPSKVLDWVMFGFCAMVSLAVLTMIGIAVWASFLKYWPYNLEFTFRHYNFASVDDAGGFRGYLNSVKLALWTSGIGTLVIFTAAYLMEKGRGFKLVRDFAHLLSMLPLAVPGLVLGLSYIFFFINPDNPLNFLYGSMAIMVICTIVHYYPVSHLIAVTSLKQMDPEFESVSASLKAPSFRTFLRVTFPVCLPAVLDISMYLFVTAMTTTSAVIFLYSPDTIVASISIINLDELGYAPSALAMGVLVILTSGTARLIHWLLTKVVLRKTQAWRHR